MGPQPVNASLSATSAVFNKQSAHALNKDVAVTLRPGDHSFVALKYGGSALTEGTHYSNEGNEFAIKKDYLQAFAEGDHIFTFEVSGGIHPQFAITVQQSSSAFTILTTGEMAKGMVGAPYSAVLQPTQATGVVWAVSAGSLPPGLELNTSTGVISGTPTQAGAFSTTVTASNGTDSHTVTLSFTIEQQGTVPTLPDHYWTNNDNSYSKGENLVFVVGYDYAKFLRIRVDGVFPTRGTHYGVAEGSTIVTLYDSYLQTLSAGTHELAVEYTDGTVVESTFKVAEKTNAGPKTGDNNYMALWIVKLLISGALIAALLILKRHR